MASKQIDEFKEHAKYDKNFPTFQGAKADYLIVNDADQSHRRLFIIFSPIPKFAHTASPSPVTARFERCTHDRFHLIRAHPMLRTDRGKADMITERHLNDLADNSR